MIPAAFEYQRVENVTQALALLKKHGERAKLIAGGHSLLPMMKLRLARPELLVDISGLQELRSIELKQDHVRIGALARHAEIGRNDVVRKIAPLFAATANQIADAQVRNRGTIGGSLCNADPAADWPAIVQAADATLVLRGPARERRVAAVDFFTGFLQTVLGAEELLEYIEVPFASAGEQVAYKKFRNPASGYSVAGVAVRGVVRAGVLTSVCIAVSGVASSAYRARAVERQLTGQRLTADLVERAVQDIADGNDVLSDPFADQEYRLQLARTMGERAIAAAFMAS